MHPETIRREAAREASSARSESGHTCASPRAPCFEWLASKEERQREHPAARQACVSGAGLSLRSADGTNPRDAERVELELKRQRSLGELYVERPRHWVRR